MLVQRQRLAGGKRGNGLVQFGLAHEAIIKTWFRLADCVDQSTENLLTRRPAEEAAREWDRSGQDESLLFGGVQLEEALEWQKRRI